MTGRLLITGGRGFVGAALAAHALTRRWKVYASVRELPPLPAPGLEYIRTTDLSATTDWSRAFPAIDVVVHCAARVHVMHETAVDSLSAFREVNVEGTLNLARQAAKAGVKRFIFISSVKVNGEETRPGHPFLESDPPAPQDAYGLSKHEAEQGLRTLAEATGIEVVIIRPPLVYGPGVKANFAALMRAVENGWPLPLGSVHNQRSLVALDNLVDFVLTCAVHPRAANQTFLVSDGHDQSTTDIVRSMANAAHAPARLLPFPAWTLHFAAALLGKREAMMRLCGSLQVDISKAYNLLGWRPPVSVEQGLHRALSGAKKS